MKPSVALIGPGKVGSAITSRLYLKGHPITAIVSRSASRARDACQFIGCSADLATTDLNQACSAQILLLAVSDDAIAQVSNTLHTSGELSPNQTLVHFSGLLPAHMLAPQKTAEIGCLSLHPLLAFADREQATKHLTGCPCALEGNSQGLETGELLAKNLEVHAFILNEKAKPTYHCAASVASNFLVTLMAVAKQLLNHCDIREDNPSALLEPLMRATLDNLFRSGPEQALTGPIVRGDVATVAAHVQALTAAQPDLLDFYQTLALQTLQLARTSGKLDSFKDTELTQLLYKINT